MIPSEEMFLTQKAQQDERLATTLLNQCDLPETAFNDEALEQPAVYDSEEDKFIAQKAQQNERLAITLHNQP